MCGEVSLCVGMLFCVHVCTAAVVLSRNIEDLHDIGKNIAVMVDDQQAAVDNIEVNVDQAGDRVTAGTGDLKKVGPCAAVCASR